MTGLEIILIIIGIVFMIGSFMVTEKLSVSELDKIAELSEREIKIIVDREMKHASEHIKEQIDDVIEDSLDKVERSLDKETNDKIMAISEYSDTVLDNMNKTHNEIMFLYSMLNDKHTELTELSGELSRLSSSIEENIEQAEIKKEETKEDQNEKQNEKISEELSVNEDTDAVNYEEVGNHNEKILELFEQGKSYMDIAKELGLGQGEVRLVVELFKGEK